MHGYGLHGNTEISMETRNTHDKRFGCLKPVYSWAQTNSVIVYNNKISHVEKKNEPV